MQGAPAAVSGRERKIIWKAGISVVIRGEDGNTIEELLRSRTVAAEDEAASVTDICECCSCDFGDGVYSGM